MNVNGEAELASPLDSLDSLAGLPARAQQAIVPFAIAEEWQEACAYERSVKFSARGIFANRYLLAFPRARVPLSAAQAACQRLIMPAPAIAQWSRLYSSASLLYLGFEDTEENALYKVYLEFEGHSRSGLSHLGWKWAAGNGAAGNPDQPIRVTRYRRLQCDSYEQHLRRLHQWSPDTSSPSREFTQSVLQTCRLCCDQLICTQVSEANGRSSYDWNVYSADHTVGRFAAPLAKLAAVYGLSSELLDRLLVIVSAARLGHVAGGTDTSGQDFCTLYYSTDQT